MMKSAELRRLLRDEGFSALFNGHPDRLTVWTTDGHFVEGNPPMMANTGYPPGQIEKVPFRDFFRIDNQELAVTEFEAAAGGQRREYLATRLRPDGQVVHARLTLVPFVRGGETVAVIAIAQDAGPLEEALAHETRSRKLLETAGRVARFGGWRMDLSTSIPTWSDELFAFLGYSSDERPPDRELLIPASSSDGVNVAAAMARVAQTGEPFDLETDVLDAAGTTLRLRLMGEAVRNDDGAIVAIQGAAIDLTERVLQRRTEARLSAVLGSIMDALIFVDKDWTISYLNPGAEKMFHTRAEVALGRDLWEVFPRAAASEFSIAARQALRDDRAVSVSGFHAPLQIWLDGTAYPTGDGLALYLRDVTQSELARQELLARNAEISAQSALLDNARDAIIVRELDSTIRYWNAAASRIYGWSHDEALGRKTRDVLYADPEQFDRALQATLSDGQWSGELQQIDKSGSRLKVESSWTLVRDAQGQPESVFSVNTDITEKRRREELDLRTQRMESLGTLASGIAHDLNNVLTPILMAVQLLSPGETDPARLEILRSTELAVKRGADMIRQVLSFASGANGRRVPVKIAEVLTEIESLRIETLPANIALRFEVAEDLWPTSGDPTQLLQVLLNLLTNARDAMPDGGEIAIRAKNVTLTDEYGSVSHPATPGDYVQVEVEDDGAGMSPDILRKIFEPFFTTKETGSGTGLGLSSSIAIIRGHGGYMQAYSELGRGSIFRLHLRADLQRRVADETAITELQEELPRGNGQLVLVVDDEAAIRILTRQTLEAYGYTTAVAGNGAEAIEIVEAGREDVQLVLTDMAMPVMDGAATAAYLLQNHPTIPVIAASGLNANGGVARAKDSGVRSFLAKPYTTTELLRAVADGLRAKPGARR